MARTSKGNTIVQDNFTQPMLYKTAIYARLSVEDTRADSNSIESQIRLCESFVNSKTNMKLVKIFDDNGFTGMNFNRPSFIKLMEMVKSGEINCVVVKDLSRLGRHYIEVVDYVEQVFPSLNVRFISVNDTVDTFAPDFNKDILMIAVKSLVNDAYARDISAKIKSTIGILRKKGYFLGSVPPYGYIKSPEDKHKLIVDEPAAEVVRLIFRWKLERVTQYEICSRLNEQGYLPPRNYFYRIGVVKNEKYEKPMLWQDSVLRQILTNEMYTGSMISGKTKKANGKTITQDREKWIITEDTHTAIVSKEDFQKVSTILEEASAKVKRTWNQPVPFEKPPALLKGIVRCGYCKKNLGTNYGKKTYKYSASYRCPICNRYSENTVNISFAEIENVVLETLQKYIATLCDYKRVVKSVNEQPTVKASVEMLSKELTLHKQNQTKLKNKLEQIYADYADDIINAEEYKILRSKYTSQLEQIEADILETENAVNLKTDNFFLNSQINSLLEKYGNIEKLDREIAENFIEYAELYNERKIHIVFRFRDEFEQYQNLASQERRLTCEQ